MKNLLKLFTNVEEMLEEGYEWTEEEVKKALNNRGDFESLADYLDRLEEIKNGADELTYEDNAGIELENNGYGYIYNMSDLDDVLSGLSPYDIALKVCYGDFNITDDYFIIDDLDHLVSSNYKSELIPEIEEITESAGIIYNIADRLINKNFDYFNKTYGTDLTDTDEIREIIEHFEELEHKQNLIEECGDLMFQ